jgi:hypothetical protein
MISAKSRRECLFGGGFFLKVAVQQLSLHNFSDRSTRA